MSPELELEQVVTDWLRNEASDSGSDRVLAAVLGRVPSVRQEPRRPAWMRRGTDHAGTVTIVAAAAAVVVIAVAGLGFLGATRGIGGGVAPMPTPSLAAPAPSPSPTPLPSAPPTTAAAAYPPEGFDIPPLDRQSLTVDGVPFSFSVRTGGWSPGIQLRESDGHFKTRSLYIGKHSTRGQAAEAVVFWTSYPYGLNTDPCVSVTSQQVGRTTPDLAAAMVAAPGTDLVTGPLDVTLAGSEAKHVVLVVREDLGCDPGYFFTWPEECWGTCWATTRIGDTISVWIVDFDGTRLVIEAETTGDAGRDLELEVQQIVDSIRFD